MDTLISNVTIVTMNEKMDVLFGAFLGIQDGKRLSPRPPPRNSPKPSSTAPAWWSSPVW